MAAEAEVVCCICLEDVGNAGQPLACGHANFHEHCIRAWPTRNRVCPMCRAIIENEEDDPVTAADYRRFWEGYAADPLRAIDDVGRLLISKVGLSIGGVAVNRVYGEYLSVWEELTGGGGGGGSGGRRPDDGGRGGGDDDDGPPKPPQTEPDGTTDDNLKPL